MDGRQKRRQLKPRSKRRCEAARQQRILAACLARAKSEIGSGITYMAKDVFIVGGARTPMTEYVGALKDVSALELGAIAAKGAFEKTGVKPEWVDHAVVGNVLQTSSDAIYGARHVALKAGVPIEVPALTVNRLCGSGIQAAVSGAQLIQLGEAGMVLTGGMESMSQAPHIIRGLRTGLRLGQGKLEDYLYEALLDPYCGRIMARYSSES